MATSSFGNNGQLRRNFATSYIPNSEKKLILQLYTSLIVKRRNFATSYIPDSEKKTTFALK